MLLDWTSLLRPGISFGMVPVGVGAFVGVGVVFNRGSCGGRDGVVDEDVDGAEAGPDAFVFVDRFLLSSKEFLEAKASLLVTPDRN